MTTRRADSLRNEERRGQIQHVARGEGELCLHGAHIVLENRPVLRALLLEDEDVVRVCVGR
eukprot:CAMPEP_0183534152 /NCGR_PEP_ID=MMETSP0371-20130417/26686_1 /TAXON_ID=268820 /ORGANISM="Peridinium aciculiferum, Strain PAER-2" /LENGTH=60 /DNA_ID=CAMNT_0025734483 /DNA_START=50 /DNA_END=229 /DNA_ORIENTATION=+